MRFLRPCLSVYTTLLLALTPAAHAACSRPIQVAVSPTGHSAIIKGHVYTGVYPEILKSIQARGGCKFVFSSVPRARQQAMFLAGEADFLFPANRTPPRDLTGHFVPMVSSRAAIMTIDPKLEVFHSLAQLRARKELRIALVRGYDYGDAYRSLAQDLTIEQRVFLEADAIGVARLLKAGFADVTIMSPSLFNSAITTDSRVSDIAPKLRIDPIDDLPWTENGIYLSTRSLSQADRNEIESQLLATVRSGQVWETYQRFYPIDVLKNSIRPR
jgi:polar amino acid transport system substrate-binding protein